MQITVETKNAISRHVSVTVPADTATAMFNTRYEKLRQTANLKGFRPGHAPLSVIKQRFKQQVQSEVTRDLVNHGLNEAFKEHKLNPINDPHVHNNGLAEEGKEYSFEAHFEVLPAIEPKNYTGLKLTKQVADVNDTLLADVLTRMKNAQTVFGAKKGAAAKGDRVTLDTEGYIDGSTDVFPGTDLKNHKVVIGSNSLIPGFEDQLEGTKAGDEKTVNVTFPKDYHNKELSGKPARFEVKIHAVEAPESVEENDDFAKTMGAENMDDLKNKIREQLAKDLAAASEQTLKKELFDELAKANTFDVPKSLIEQEFNTIWRSQMQQLQQQGLGIEAMGANVDETRTEFRSLAERRVRLGLLLTEIAKKENLDVTADDVTTEIERIAAQYGDKAAEIKQRIQSTPELRNQVVGPLFEQKVVSWLLENNNITDKKVTPQELQNAVN